MSDIQPDTLSPENLSPGRTLAAARNERGLSVEEVAHRLKFSVRQIEALESDRYDALAGSTVVRGMMRAYAKILGLDATPLVADLQRRVIPDNLTINPPKVEARFQAAPRRGSKTYLLLSILVGLCVAAVIAEWYLRTQLATELPAMVAPSRPSAPAAPVSNAEPPAALPPGDAAPALAIQPEPAPVATVPPTAPGPMKGTAAGAMPAAPAVDAATGKPALPRIDLSFDRDSWVEVKDAGGAVLLSQLNPAGTTKSIEGVAPFQLVVGNASGVRIALDGQPVKLEPNRDSDVARLTLK